MVKNLDIHAHKLLPGAAQAVQRPGLDKVLDGPLVQLLVGHTGNEVLQVGKGPSLPSLLLDSVNYRPAHTLDGRQGVADFPSVTAKPL